MDTPSIIVVVHDRAAPEARVLIALCPDDLALLKRGLGWVVLDEVVGISRTLACEACAGLDVEEPAMHAVGEQGTPASSARPGAIGSADTRRRSSTAAAATAGLVISPVPIWLLQTFPKAGWPAVTLAVLSMCAGGAALTDVIDRLVIQRQGQAMPQATPAGRS